MERAIEILAALFFLAISLSHILQPRAWVEYFTWLREKGRAGMFVEGRLQVGTAEVMAVPRQAVVSRDGYAAARWLADETLNSALAEVRGQAIDVWRTSRDPETRERAWLMLQQTDLFVAQLEKAVERKDLLEAR